MNFFLSFLLLNLHQAQKNTLYHQGGGGVRREFFEDNMLGLGLIFRKSQKISYSQLYLR